MKLVSVMQFYLPYVLPRAPDWEGHGIAAEIQNLLAKVSPRGTNDVLFPSEIDQTLSTIELTLRRVSLPSSAATHTVRDLSHDRMQVSVEGEANFDDASRLQIEERFKRVGVKAANMFLDHCRVVANVPFIRGVEEQYRIQDGRRYIMNPHTITWFDATTGERYPFYEGNVNASASSGAISSPERGSASMAAIVESLRISQNPDLATILLLDASEQLISLRLREAILSLGTACEVASNRYLASKGSMNEAAVGKILNSQQSFAEKRFHLIPLLVSANSLKNTDQRTFDLLEKLYRARNSVAHEAVAEFKNGSTVVRVDLPLATLFLDAARRSVKWITAL